MTRATMLTVWFRMMKSTAGFLLMMAAEALSSPHGLAHPGCEEDHECSENMFCYKMRSCVDCYNCALYYRKPNAKKICAREPSECGECVDGYEAEILTNGNERDYCRIMEKPAPVLIPGTAPSVNYTTMLIIGGVIVTIVVIVAGYLIHRWRKMRYRGADQAVQNMQETLNAGSGNGMSPLLGNTNGRKPSLGEQIPCNRPSAPPQPPPYENTLPPLRDEATFVVERTVKCKEAVCFREPGLQISSFPDEGQDDQSTDGSDTDAIFHPDINIESGYPSAFHDDDTLPASADGTDEIVEQSETNLQPNAEAPSFLGVLMNVGVNNSGGSEACDLNDSGLSQASSNVSVSSLSAEEEEELKFDTPNRSETHHADGCRQEHHAMKRSGWQREEITTLDAADVTLNGALLRIAVPNSDTEAQRAGDSSVSQASSSASISSNTAVPHSSSDGPLVKRRKFDSGNSSTAEDLQEDEETCRSQESPRINVQAVTVLNVQNVVNYNIQNTSNTP
ncbi:uncharacterized protein LOC126188980 isoform X1 [Schistocerca cancellata]|uniref:uncharacterized protein LOC126188980 isoform X1 n=1 Tax=Schistocerca cancellata TaxID=274614 RepID=UPI002118D6B6|nr:uncharacterized protein LOC126188980 isoform X1 [Schistocerca cancellata]